MKIHIIFKTFLTKILCDKDVDIIVDNLVLYVYLYIYH